MRQRACIFIDGENFRWNLRDLFPAWDRPGWYLPDTDWGTFFKHIIGAAEQELEIPGSHLDLVRCYWYVIAECTYDSTFETSTFQKTPLDNRLPYYSKNASSVIGDQRSLSDLKAKTKAVERAEAHLKKQRETLHKNQEGWHKVQRAIQNQTNKLQFRRFGYINVILDRMQFQQEKGVDVKLALDMVLLHRIYDVAILVSGDADYIPAVEAVKEYGKHVVNIDFLTQDGKLLPGGARRLKESCDATVSLAHADMARLFDYQTT